MPDNPTQPDQVSETPTPFWRQLLRRSDQATVACFLCIGLIGLVCWIARLGGDTGEAVELDRAIERHAAFQIDMNRAEWAEWAELPGVGEAIARRIVEFRETEGGFVTPEDLMQVKGIGPKTLEQIRPYLLPDPDMQNVAGDF